jgi:hypothetical protein
MHAATVPSEAETEAAAAVRHGHSGTGRVLVCKEIQSDGLFSVAPVKGSSRLIELVARATSGDWPETTATARVDSRTTEMLTR